MKYAAIILLVCAGTAYAGAFPTPQPATTRTPTMEQYNTLKAHVRAIDREIATMAGCMRSTVPVYVHDQGDGVTYLVTPADAPYPAGTTFLLSTDCVAP